MLNRNGAGAGSPRRLATFVGALMMLALLSGCSLHGKSKVAHDNPAPAVTPNAINKLPQNLNEVSVDITNGAFGSASIDFQLQGGSTIHLVNHDAVAYKFEITPNLVNARAVAASTTTTISFTAVTAGAYTGTLLSAKDGSVLASVAVRVQGAGAVNL